MLRTVLAGVRASTWPLAEELALLDTLFELHRLRDPDRVRVTRRLPSRCPTSRSRRCCCCRWPRNAVKHGPAAGHAGEIVLTAGHDRRTAGRVDRNPGAYRGRRPAAAASKSSSAGWRSPMMIRRC
jgi:hypothetical protein